MTVIVVAGLAIIINGATAWLTFHESKNSQNIHAAFLHNLTDMFSSVGVVIRRDWSLDVSMDVD